MLNILSVLPSQKTKTCQRGGLPFWLFLSAFFLLASCGPLDDDDDDDNDVQTSTTITIAASQDSVEVGQSIVLTAALSDETSSLAWLSSDEAIATINEAGVLTAIAVGTVSVTATASTNEAVFTSNTLIIDIVSKSILQIAEISDVHLGDTNVAFSATLSGAPRTTALSWEIPDNNDAMYGSIDASTGLYQAPKAWPQSLGSVIAFSIKAETTEDPKVKTIKQVVIKTDTFPNSLELTRENRADYSETISGFTYIYLGVTEIGMTAFYSKGLTGVVIPNSVTSIGDAAFQYNKLKSVTIPESVTSIGEVAFGNNGLTEGLTLLPASVTIGDGAFTPNYNGLKSVVLNLALWETIKGSLDKLFGSRVESYRDLDGNDLVASIEIYTVRTIPSGEKLRTNATVVVVGQSVTLDARTRPRGVLVTWAVDDEAIATITQAGVLSGVADGTVTVTASSGAVVSNDLSIEVATAPDLEIEGPSEVYLGDPDVAFTIATGELVSWVIQDNASNEYGLISNTGVVSGSDGRTPTGKYQAPEFWEATEPPSAPITFTIVATNADASRSASKQVTISMDSFPNNLVLSNLNFSHYTNGNHADFHVYLGVTHIKAGTFTFGLRALKLPKSVRDIENNAFINNTPPIGKSELTSVTLPVALWNVLKTNLAAKFGPQVNRYADSDGTVHLGITLTAPQSTVAVGGTLTLSATTAPTAGEAVTWAVDDETVAIITQAGVLSGVAAGTVTVTASSGAVSQSTEISVTP